jgi:DNA-directed RNA polymerase subunit RPC12/RpoP
MTGQHQIPILCAKCGGPTTPADDGSLACPYCGHPDRLPADELGRALELKRRVAQAANGVAQLHGLESTLGWIYESRGVFVRAMLPWLVVAPLILAQQLWSAWPAIERAPSNLRPSLAVTALMGPMFIAALLLAVAVALAIGRRRYRRHVRPLMGARPPRAPGLPARCRACGADLPTTSRGPYIGCEFCRTQSLVTAELMQHSAAALESEQRAYRERANKIVAAQSTSSVGMSRALVIGVAVAYASMIGVAYLAQALLPSS